MGNAWAEMRGPRLVKNKNNSVRNKYKLFYSLDYLLNMGHYLNFKLFLKVTKLINKLNGISLAWCEVYLFGKKKKRKYDFMQKRKISYYELIFFHIILVLIESLFEF